MRNFQDTFSRNGMKLKTWNGIATWQKPLICGLYNYFSFHQNIYSKYESLAYSNIITTYYTNCNYTCIFRETIIFYGGVIKELLWSKMYC